MSESLDTPVGALAKASREYNSVVQLNGYGKGDNEDKAVFAILVCATDDLDFNTRVLERLNAVVEESQGW